LIFLSSTLYMEHAHASHVSAASQWGVLDRSASTDQAAQVPGAPAQCAVCSVPTQRPRLLYDYADATCWMACCVVQHVGWPAVWYNMLDGLLCGIEEASDCAGARIDGTPPPCSEVRAPPKVLRSPQKSSEVLRSPQTCAPSPHARAPCARCAASPARHTRSTTCRAGHPARARTAAV